MKTSQKVEKYSVAQNKLQASDKFTVYIVLVALGDNNTI